jgi:hypothetical protein
MSVRGLETHLSERQVEQLMQFFDRGLTTKQIRAEGVNISKYVIQFWRARHSDYRAGVTFSGLRKPGELAIARLCFVNGCHDPAVAGKYCAAHAHTPGRNAIGSTAPLSRLMGTR